MSMHLCKRTWGASKLGHILVKLTNFMLSFCFAFSYLKFYFEILLSKLDRQQQFESTFAAIIEIFFYIGFGSTNIFALKLHDTQHYPDRCAH